MGGLDPKDHGWLYDERSAAAPVVWRYRRIGSGPQWYYISTKPKLGKHPDDEWEVEPLYRGGET
ncbi:hypothetical protein LCGC14_1113720 [marine sediment metagenome]|uniref:Uncharacterized protein n=1 Tax=marine sediment metagenome TaxID=412755 RepID=A0A0F9QC37_9ZZZZ